MHNAPIDRQSLTRLALAGLVAGMAMSVTLSDLISSMLFGIRPLAWPVYAGVALGLFVTALAAGWLPAVRAGRMDPLSVLRAE